MHWEDAGGWTGEISAPMLLEEGAALAIPPKVDLGGIGASGAGK